MKLENCEIKRYGHRLNQELKAQGFLTIAGRISWDYLLQRTVGKATEEEAQRDECL